MRRNLLAVLDACVLIPMPLADTLLRIAAGPQLYFPKWSDRIMAEVNRNLREKFGLNSDRTAYRENEIRRHFPEAWVEGYEELIPTMKNNDKDRHVRAAAVHVHADIIVTYNAKDFPESALVPYSVAVQGPSTFLKNLYGLDPERVMQVLREQALAIGKTVEYVLDRLHVNAPGFVNVIRSKHDAALID